MTYGSARRQLDVPYVTGVQDADVQREIDYCSKEDSAVPNGVKIYLGNKRSVLFESLWPNVINCVTARDALSIVKDQKPELYFLKRKSLCESFDAEFGKCTQALFSNFNVSHENVWDNLTHVFIGPTGIGKSNFALAHFKKPVHVTNYQNFSRISENPDITDGVVIDDVELCKLSGHKLLQLVDKQFEHGVDAKYGYGYIPAMLPRIVVLNSMEYFWPSGISSTLRSAINRRIKVHFYNARLYDTNVEVSTDIYSSIYKPSSDIKLAPKKVSPIPSKPIISTTDSNDPMWMSKKRLKQSDDIVETSIKKEVDVTKTCRNMGMKTPLPEQYEGFLKWLERKKNKELIEYINVDKLYKTDVDDSDYEDL